MILSTCHHVIFFPRAHDQLHLLSFPTRRLFRSGEVLAFGSFFLRLGSGSATSATGSGAAAGDGGCRAATGSAGAGPAGAGSAAAAGAGGVTAASTTS